jgi:hypothetical protein
MMWFVLSLCFLLAQCALPPGYEEELYCPPSACLRPAHRRPGLCGPRSLFHECFNELTRETTRPHSWGEKVAVAVKEDLLRRGWHTAECARSGRTAQLQSILRRLTGLSV